MSNDGASSDTDSNPVNCTGSDMRTPGRIRRIPVNAIQDFFGSVTTRRVEWKPIASRQKPLQAITDNAKAAKSPASGPWTHHRHGKPCPKHPVSPRRGYGTETTLSLPAAWRGATDMERHGLWPITRRPGTKGSGDGKHDAEARPAPARLTLAPRLARAGVGGRFRCPSAG